MKLHTASEVISLAKKLENESAKFYMDLAQRYAKDEEVFLRFAKENGKNVVQIERAYYGVITDAIEGCFAFDINPDEYAFETALPESASYSNALDKAVEIEGKTIEFYSDAAKQAKSLMADVPRNFVMVAKRRGDRAQKLRSLLDGEG